MHPNSTMRSLNSNGIAAFVLKYRLAKAPNSTYTLPKEVYADAARSVRLVRNRAKEWNVDPARIGFIGFSAGGEVAGMIKTKYDAGNTDSPDPIERLSSRPDFTAIIGSRRRIFRNDYTRRQTSTISALIESTLYCS